jgi:hypothetical protein
VRGASTPVSIEWCPWTRRGTYIAGSFRRAAFPRARPCPPQEVPRETAGWGPPPEDLDEIRDDITLPDVEARDTGTDDARVVDTSTSRLDAVCVRPAPRKESTLMKQRLMKQGADAQHRSMPPTLTDT